MSRGKTFPDAAVLGGSPKFKALLAASADIHGAGVFAGAFARFGTLNA